MTHPQTPMTHTVAAVLILSCSHFAAVSLAELAQAIPPPNFETSAVVGIRVGKGLTMDDTLQQLSFGDSPQVINMHFFKLLAQSAILKIAQFVL